MMNPDNLKLLMCLATFGITGATLYLYLDKDKIKDKDKDKDKDKGKGTYLDNPNPEEIKTYMRLELENNMIIWKKKNPTKSSIYNEFIKDSFPENTKLDNKGNILWIDPRVKGETWLSAFKNTSDTQNLHILGNPPNTIIL